MRPRTQAFRWDSVRGFNRRDTPQSLPDDIAASCDNVELLAGSLGRRRPTCAPVSLTSGPSLQVRFLFSHYTSASDVSELWAISEDASTVEFDRRVNGTWSSVTPYDTPATSFNAHPSAASLNNKLFLAYNSASNRLKVWDGTSVRFVGLQKPAAATVANGGGVGAYAATARYYRIQMRIKSGTRIVAQSELSNAVSFTPDGSSLNATVTKPATVDSATHWVVYGLIGSAGDTYALYEELAEIVVGTTTYADTTAPASYSGDFPPELGLNIPPPSAKYLLATDNRLLMAGAFESSSSAGETAVVDDRVWFTRVLGTSDRGDDESIPLTTTQSNYIDVGRNDGDTVVGFGGPVDGIIYVFKKRSIWRLIPTGIDTVPYRAEIVTRSVGASTPNTTLSTGPFNQRNIVLAEDEFGQSVLYFIAPSGAHRLSPGGGLEYVGWDVSDPTTGRGPAFIGGIYVPAFRQLWWADYASNTNIYVYTPHLARRTDLGWRGGWSRYSVSHLGVGTVMSLVMNDVTLDGTLRYPVIGCRATSTLAAQIFAFTGTDTKDDGTPFTVSIVSKPFLLGGGTHHVSLDSPILEAVANAAAGPTIALRIDHGRETRSAVLAALGATGSETRVIRTVEGVEGADAQAVAVTLTWGTDHSEVMDALTMRFRIQEAL